MYLIDTNIFIRFITQDDPKKGVACLEFFRKIEQGELTATTTEAVLSEIVSVLISKALYGFDRKSIVIPLLSLLHLENIRLAQKSVYFRALDIYKNSNVDFEDAVIVARMEKEKIETLYSYDKDFDQFTGIRRNEP